LKDARYEKPDIREAFMQTSYQVRYDSLLH